MPFAPQSIFPKKALHRYLTQPNRLDRIDLMKTGASELISWISNLFGKGLTQLLTSNKFEIERIAVRMVDTQNSSSARKLRIIAGQLDKNDWSEKLCIDQLMSLYFLSRALLKIEHLPLLVRSELLQICGVNWRKKDLEWTEPINDHWLCLHQEEKWVENIRQSSSWFWGVHTGIFTCYNQFVFRFAPFDHPIKTGKIYRGNFKFFPSATPINGYASEDFQPSDIPFQWTAEEFNKMNYKTADYIARNPIKTEWPVTMHLSHFQSSPSLLTQLQEPHSKRILDLLNFAAVDPELWVFGLWTHSVFSPVSLLNKKGVFPLDQWMN